MTTMTVTGYAAEVRRALDDLPPAVADQLVEGLDEHLAEIGIDDIASLVAVLGPPDRYAAELRVSAGLPSPAPTRPSIPLPPPVLPVTAAPITAPPGVGVTIGGRHVARVALVVIGLATVFGLSRAGDVEPAAVVTITVAVGAAAALLWWVARAAGLRRPWDHVALAVFAALAIAVATTAGAGHRRTYYYPSDPVATKMFGLTTPVPDLTNFNVHDAIDTVDALGLVPVVTGDADASHVVVAQDPPPGRIVAPGSEVHLVTDAPRTTRPASTFPARPTTTG
jgi:uncharacterized membrane protein